MMFSGLQGMTIPEGVVTQIAKDGVVMWKLETSKPVILEVEKATVDTFAGGTTYTGEQFILLDIYPKTNGTVNVTYGGLTKTITDISGAEEPNAQRVFFGTFNGVSDSITTPTSGTLTIEGDCDAFGAGAFNKSSKDVLQPYCWCIVEIKSFGNVSYIPNEAITGLAQGVVSPKFKQSHLKIPSTIKSIGEESFYSCSALLSLDIGVEILGTNCFCLCQNLFDVVISKSVKKIGADAFLRTTSLKTIKIQATTPPELVAKTSTDGTTVYNNFGKIGDEGYFYLEQLIVPKGCGNTYKTAEGWSYYADYIVEES